MTVRGRIGTLTGTQIWKTKYEGKFIKTAKNGRVTGATNGSQTLF